MTKTADYSTTSVNEVSRIAQGVIIKGDISSRSDIRVDGQMNGKLFSEGRVIVGETAVIQGSLICTDVDLFGKVEGDLYVNNVLSVKGSAIINGNIHVRKLQVEMGAQINGTCSMIGEEEFRQFADQVVSVKLPSEKKPAPRKVEPAPAPKVEAPALDLKEDENAAQTEEPKPRKSPFSY